MLFEQRGGMISLDAARWMLNAVSLANRLSPSPIGQFCSLAYVSSFIFSSFYPVDCCAHFFVIVLSARYFINYFCLLISQQKCTGYSGPSPWSTWLHNQGRGDEQTVSPTCRSILRVARFLRVESRKLVSAIERNSESSAICS